MLKAVELNLIEIQRMTVIRRIIYNNLLLK